jgi:signal transduction histidine kinase/DNA-binding NarL/FixJ family response regulator/HPt (histidine-containing phosphotransfer) domain-containing protein
LTSFIILIALALGGVTLTAGYGIVRGIMERYYAGFGRNLARTAAALIDGDSLDRYLSTLITDQQYEDTLRLLRILRKENEVLYLYVIKVSSPVMTYFIYDSDENNALPLGYPDPWQENYGEYGEQLFRGEAVEPIVSDGPYGWIMTIYEPIYGREGAIAGYVGLDYSMDQIAVEYRAYLFSLGIIVALVIAVSAVLYGYFIHRRVMAPLNTIINAAGEFLISSGKGPSGIAALDIRTQDELQNLMEALQFMEQKINRTIEDLVKTEEAARAASRAKSAFLARMSHEIRTPLNAIIGLSEVELQDEIPSKTRTNLEKIYSSGATLLEIINDILDISKIETGNYEITPVNYDVAGIINDTIQLNIVRIGSKPIEFRLKLAESLPRRLFGDELRIKQILNNLLSNAIKYTERGEVTLGLDWERQGDTAWLHFSVRDTGRGIKQEDLGKLFSEYTQLDVMANRKIEGTGLGLSITKGLVQIMGGSIKVESEYGKGRLIEVRLPQGIEGEAPLGRELADQLRGFRFYEDRNRRGNIIRRHMPYGRVLVVDDVMMNLDVIKGLMMPYGLQVDTVMSGQEAVERIGREEVRYDLVFMDHMMPEMDGIQAVRIIRNEIDSEYARNLPIIALTANAITGTRELFLNSGFNDYISKPIDIKQLDRALNKWVRDTQSPETLKQAEQENHGQEGKENPKDLPGDDDRRFFGQSIKGVDLDAARALYRDSAAYLPILRSFAAHIPPLLDEMSALVEGDLGQYAIKVHGLKGSCDTICAPETTGMARELETAAKAGDLDFIRAHHGALEKAALALAGELAERFGVRGREPPGGAGESRSAPDRALLGRLAAAASELRTGEIEEILKALEQFRYETGEDLVRWLREQTDNFEYGEIQGRLKEHLAGGGG